MPKPGLCASTQGSGEPWEGAGMTQGSRQSRRGGACVLLLALFMNVCLWLPCVGGVCVSVNECRCVIVNERLKRDAGGGRMEGEVTGRP